MKDLWTNACAMRKKVKKEKRDYTATTKRLELAYYFLSRIEKGRLRKSRNNARAKSGLTSF